MLGYKTLILKNIGQGTGCGAVDGPEANSRGNAASTGQFSKTGTQYRAWREEMMLVDLKKVG
jgi:hypothetical protein